MPSSDLPTKSSLSSARQSMSDEIFSSSSKGINSSSLTITPRKGDRLSASNIAADPNTSTGSNAMSLNDKKVDNGNSSGTESKLQWSPLPMLAHGKIIKSFLPIEKFPSLAVSAFYQNLFYGDEVFLFETNNANWVLSLIHI